MKETEKYIDIDKSQYIISESNKEAPNTWMLKLKRWILKNL